MVLTKTEQERLAEIRRDAEEWQAVNPDAANWDAAFLLRIIDQLRMKSK